MSGRQVRLLFPHELSQIPLQMSSQYKIIRKKKSSPFFSFEKNKRAFTSLEMRNKLNDNSTPI